jgi:hypothetical protein
MGFKTSPGVYSRDIDLNDLFDNINQFWITNNTNNESENTFKHKENYHIDPELGY